MDNNHCCACGIGECMGHWFFKTADKMVVCSNCLLKIQTVLGKAFKMTLTDKEEKAFAKSHTSDYFIENVKGIESITDLKDGLSFVVNYEKKTILCNCRKQGSPIFSNAVHRFDQIIKYENGQNTYEVQKGNAGHPIMRAIVGGAVAGPAGAVVGAMTRKDTRRTETRQGEYYINLYFQEDDGSVSIASKLFGQDGVNQNASMEYAKFEAFIKKVFTVEEEPGDAAPAPNSAIPAADEIKKFKELLDMGAITQEEYNAKKKQLLGL